MSQYERLNVVERAIQFIKGLFRRDNEVRLGDAIPLDSNIHIGIHNINAAMGDNYCMAYHTTKNPGAYNQTDKFEFHWAGEHGMTFDTVEELNAFTLGFMYAIMASYKMKKRHMLKVIKNKGMLQQCQ